jgi:argininosuccinate lyase
VDVAEKNVDVILPGFTHLQVAQPVSFGHHLLAYVEMFARDAERLADVRKRVNRLPLGAPRWPAPATRWTASAWPARWAWWTTGPQVCQNSLDAVSDRDFAIEFTAAPACAWCTSAA